MPSQSVVRAPSPGLPSLDEPSQACIKHTMEPIQWPGAVSALLCESSPTHSPTAALKTHNNSSPTFACCFCICTPCVVSPSNTNSALCLTRPDAISPAVDSDLLLSNRAHTALLVPPGQHTQHAQALYHHINSMSRRQTLGALSPGALNSRQSSANMLGPSRTGKQDGAAGGPRQSLKPGAGRPSMAPPRPSDALDPRRSSAFGKGGNSGVKADPRPLGNKEYFSNCLKTVIAYLSTHGYPYAVSPKLLASPTGECWRGTQHAAARCYGDIIRCCACIYVWRGSDAAAWCCLTVLLLA